MSKPYLGNFLKKSGPIHIIGAGFSGLCLAHFLKNHQVPFKISDPHLPGGKLSTSFLPGYGIIEKAANALYADATIIDFLEKNNLSYIKAQKVKRLLMLQEKQPRPFPFFPELWKKVLFNQFKKIPTNPQSIGDFFSPLLGESITREVISTALQGIYGIHGLKLDARNILNFQNKKRYYQWLFQKRERKYSLSFYNGMQELIDFFHQSISEHLTAQQVDRFNPQEFTIFCSSAFSAGQLLQKEHPLEAKLLQQITYSPLTSTTLFFETSLPYLKKSFGCLFSPTLQSPFLGIVANQEIFPEQRRKYPSYTIMSSSPLEPSFFKEELQRLFGHQSTPLKIVSTSWEQAIPLYDSSHFQVIEQLTQKSEHLPFILFGNYIRGISLREIFHGAQKLAHDIARAYHR